MGVTQYIGARYVPIFADPAEWTKARTYEPLTIVMHDGNSFTSKQFVPIGIDINNDKFWAETGNYNAQVEAYRQEVLNNSDKVDEYTEYFSEKGFTFNTVADMKASELLYVGAICHTNGFHNSGDGGAAWYLISDNGTANEMDIIRCKNLYAHLLITENYVSPEMFGAYGNGINDDTEYINYALTKANNLIGKNEYLITEIDITGKNVTLNKVSDCVIKSNGSQTEPSNLNINIAQKLALGNFKNSIFKISYVDELRVSPIDSAAYNKVYFGICNKLYIGTNESAAWVNENYFYGRIVNGIYFIGNYSHNCNYFYSSSEGAAFEIKNNGSSSIHDNYFYTYGENFNTSNFDFGNGFNNIVKRFQNSYSTSFRNAVSNILKNGNAVVNEIFNSFRSVFSDCLTVPNVNGNTITNYSTVKYYLISVPNNELVYMQFSTNLNAFRNRIYAFDENFNPVDISDIANDQINNSIRPHTTYNNCKWFTNSFGTIPMTLPSIENVKYWVVEIYHYTGNPIKFMNTNFYSQTLSTQVSILESFDNSIYFQ